MTHIMKYCPAPDLVSLAFFAANLHTYHQNHHDFFVLHHRLSVAISKKESQGVSEGMLTQKNEGNRLNQ